MTGAPAASAGTFAVEVTSGSDRLTYARDEDGGRTVTGTFRGRKVNQESAG